jgi:hypothetical protein
MRLRIGLGRIGAALLLAAAADGREIQLHAGAFVLTPLSPAYEATLRLSCPSERAARVGVGGHQTDGAAAAELIVLINDTPAGALNVDASVPTHWLDLRIPAGESRVRIEARGLGAGQAVRSSDLAILLLDDTDCTLSAVCEDLADVTINCAGLEPFVCSLLGLESDLYCKQLELDRIAVRYARYPDPSPEIWTPEDRAVHQRLTPQLEALVARQRELYAQLEAFSRKQPRQLKAYLDVHRQLELHYQRKLATLR